MSIERKKKKTTRIRTVIVLSWSLIKIIMIYRIDPLRINFVRLQQWRARYCRFGRAGKPPRPRAPSTVLLRSVLSNIIGYIKRNNKKLKISRPRSSTRFENISPFKIIILLGYKTRRLLSHKLQNLFYTNARHVPRPPLFQTR